MRDDTDMSLMGPARELSVSWGVQSPHWLPEALFADVLTRDSLRWLRQEQFAVAGEELPDLGDVGETVISRRDETGTRALVRLADTAVALVDARRGSVAVEIAARSAAAVDALYDELTQRLGAAEEREDEVSVRFWALAQHGPRSARRRITAPDWPQVAANYSQRAARGVAELITSRVPGSGRLVLWHGEPGTGKTHALRALSRVWSDWCSTHYVTDPEAFLGHGTSYLLDVLTSEESGRAGAARWKLIVLEDSGELLSADAHERTGQALSRLLNTTDGVLGQGMKAIVLITTNEPLGRLHPAIKRPGRCWKEIEFAPLDALEANRWLATHDSTTRVTVPTPLADLYSILRGRRPERVRPFGFGATK